MDEKKLELIRAFVHGEILTEVDRGLRRAVTELLDNYESLQYYHHLDNDTSMDTDIEFARNLQSPSEKAGEDPK